MQHSRILNKNAISTLYIDYDDSIPVSIKKLQITDSVIELVPDELTYNGKFWTSNIKIPNEDCYIAIVVYRNNEIIDQVIVRSGVPSLKNILYK